MRVFICVIPLLCGCSTQAVRCDAHLQPINPPAARDAPSSTATPGVPAAIQAGSARGAP